MIRIVLAIVEQEQLPAGADGTRPVAIDCELRGIATRAEREAVQKLGAAINAQMREWSHPGFNFMEGRK